MEFLKRLLDDGERARQELAVQSRLLPMMGGSKGWGSPELEPLYARARELCAQIRDPALTFPVLFEQWITRWFKLELREGMEVADELLAIAEEAKDAKMLLSAHWARGTTLFERGELVSAKEHMEKPLAVYELGQRLPITRRSYVGQGRSEFCTLPSINSAIPIRAWANTRSISFRACDPRAPPEFACIGGTVHVLMTRPLADQPGTDVTVLTVDYPPNGSTPPHEHPGHTYAYVLEGAVVSQLDDQPPQTYTTGQMWSVSAALGESSIKNWNHWQS
jgi:hypothetical protein